MSYLLDTNVISELARSSPDANVVAWADRLPPETVHISALTLGEIRKGVESLKDGALRRRLEPWLEHGLSNWFENRILPIDAAVADCWGSLLAQMGRSVPAIDSLLAATALSHGLDLATRNTKDFQFPGLNIVNPWAA